jgi:hypothetical protein
VADLLEHLPHHRPDAQQLCGMLDHRALGPLLDDDAALR